MSGRKGMKQYSESIKDEIRKLVDQGESVSHLSKVYGIRRYSIQSWCGLRPETRLRQIAPLPSGRAKAVKSLEDYEKENKRLKMENELLWDFLRSTERK